MAFAALHSLLHTIEGLVDSSRISVTSPTLEILQSAFDHAWSLKSTLQYCREGVTALEERIIMEEARKLEDAIEFPLLIQCESGEGCSPTFDQLRQDVDCFAETAKKMEENIEDQKIAMMIEDYIEELWNQMIEEYFEELFEPKTQEEDFSSETEECDMVGLSDQFLMMRHVLASGERAEALLFWISGMAGIGKTTFAKRIYHDPWVKANFESRAFVRVGQEFRLDEVLQAIAAQLNLDYEEMIVEGDKDLYECFHRILAYRKSLIVLDDVWEDTFVSRLLLDDVWEDTFVDNVWKDPFASRVRLDDVFKYPKSQILVTSRTDVFSDYIFKLKMRFMNEEESWELLRRKVFGEEEECPPLLVKPGKKIAKKCEGLPLLIIAAAPILLSKAQKNPESWNRVAEKPNSLLEDASHQISEVLLSSYHQISEEEKLCFLYIAAFPLNYIVRRSTITNLWCAEGFIGDFDFFWFKSFNMLVGRNLVVGHQKCWSSSYETKACSLHCAYWFVSKRVAENNKFLYTINSCADDLDECVKAHRRLAIYENVLFAIKEVHTKIATISTVRSLLCTGPYHQYQVPICLELRLLRVLSALTIRFYEFPVEVVKLIRLRYLALTCNANLPPSISKLWNLQYLIVHQHWSIKRVAADQSYVPVEIWDLQELKHLEIMGRNLSDPPHPGVVLPNLERLLGVGVESCTKGVLESMPNLKKLRIQIELAPHAAAQTLSCFDHISCLPRLYSFQSIIMNPTLVLRPLSISTSVLTKLSLSGFGYPWEDMSKIAELPNLQVLKLQCYAFRGEKWEAKEMRFSSLRNLFIEDTDLVQWTAEYETFPELYHLSMKNCHKLQEIPHFISRRRIELVDCNPSAETCAKQKHPTYWIRRMYNDAEKVTANYSWK